MYTPIACIGAIQLLLSFACANDFNLFQMDIKSAFLNGIIKEEVNVEEHHGFDDCDQPNWVYHALYGMKQAPRAWYEKMKFLIIAHVTKLFMQSLKYTNFGQKNL